VGQFWTEQTVQSQIQHNSAWNWVQ